MSDNTGNKNCDILDGFNGTIERHKPSIFYKIALLITAFVMVLLPVIYVCIIIGVGFLVYKHAMNFENIASIGGSSRTSGKAVILLYVGPLVIGVIVIILMIKPLFARKPKEPEQFIARPEDEPLLHDFINAICKQIGAPAPKKVYINLEVNAYAGFIKSPFALTNRGLGLTIGLPLLACMDLRMLAGIIAHEFGHFSQGMGMRLSYIIKSVNIWFASVVYERDKCDIWLKEASSTGVSYIMIIAQVARLMVFLTRRILWLLMMLGHIISCYMSRQMEYDADRYEAKLTGSDHYKDASLAMYYISCAYNKAMEEIGDSWSQKKLCNDIASFSKLMLTKLPEEGKKEITKDILAEKVGVFATHPSTADRIRQAEAYQEPGIFKDKRSAHVLLSDIQKISQYLTKKYYQNALGTNFNEQYLVPFNDFIGVKAVDEKDNISYRKFYYDIIDVDNPLSLDMSKPEDISDLATGVSELGQLCKEIEEKLESAKEARKEYDTIDEDIYRFHRIKALVETGFEYKDEKYGKFAANNPNKVQMVIDQLNQKQSKHKSTIAEFSEMISKRLSLSLQLALDKSFAAKNTDEKFAIKVKTITNNMKILSSCFADIKEIQIAASQLDTLFRYMDGNETEQVIISSINKRLEGIKGRLDKLYTKLKDTKYPFNHTTKNISIGDYTFDVNSITGDASQLYNAVGDAISNTYKLYAKLLGRLANLTISAESSCGYNNEKHVSA